MQNIITDYLKKRACHGGWPLAGETRGQPCSCAVVIPALAEHACLFDTLFALTASSSAAVASTQVIIVINNRKPPHAAADDIADNTRTLEALKQCAAQHVFAPLRLAWADAASPGCELPEKEGVGLARKIGGDHALRLFAAAGKPGAPIVHLDADSPPAPGYLDAILAFYASGAQWGGYAAYQHPTDAATRQGRVMIAYEIYLRYHELSLQYAGSPYAYPALGSVMSSAARAYAAAGGMNRRCAGEDFYFMQQLVKTGVLRQIPHALVYPSGRQSQRTPFGTGRAVTAGNNDAHVFASLFHPESYEVLRRWLALAAEAITLPGGAVLDRAAGIHPELVRLLEKRGFTKAWERIAVNHPEPANRLRQFHVWFDGLRAIQLVHHLRDTAFPNVSASEAIAALSARLESDKTIRLRALYQKIAPYVSRPRR
ncbi:MAG TPA: hypothetical protein ENN29_09715 [Candidatus Hydrogenedentes bacterium]|nr:hypothetical protein [Candidatus Hydrogenedentota bacterium]